MFRIGRKRPLGHRSSPAVVVWETLPEEEETKLIVSILSKLARQYALAVWLAGCVDIAFFYTQNINKTCTQSGSQLRRVACKAKKNIVEIKKFTTLSALPSRNAQFSSCECVTWCEVTVKKRDLRRYCVTPGA